MWTYNDLWGYYWVIGNIMKVMPHYGDGLFIFFMGMYDD
jgi:hypothetical protein